MFVAIDEFVDALHVGVLVVVWGFGSGLGCLYCWLFLSCVMGCSMYWCRCLVVLEVFDSAVGLVLLLR